MRAALQAFFAILAAIITMVAVFAIKRGVEWETRDWSIGALDALLALVLALAVLAVLWTYLLRPAIERRQQAQDPGLRQTSERERAGD